MRILLIIFVAMMQLAFIPAEAVGQTEGLEQEELPYLHSPHKASVYSAILPGLGQYYNKKYWKIPIVYAGIGTIGYFALANRSEYRKAREAYIYVFNEEDYPIDNDLVGRYDASTLRDIRDFYRRNMELSYILLAVWYALNIVDAAVDAHFFHYDVSDNLSVQIEPAFLPDFASIKRASLLKSNPGIRLKINF
jgi:hypothetical protein